MCDKNNDISTLFNVCVFFVQFFYDFRSFFKFQSHENCVRMNGMRCVRVIKRAPPQKEMHGEEKTAEKLVFIHACSFVRSLVSFDSLISSSAKNHRARKERKKEKKQMPKIDSQFHVTGCHINAFI